MRAVLYARVSTVDKGRTRRCSLARLREYAARRGFEVVVELVDFASGHRNGRPEYQRMFDAPRKRRFDVLLVWRYDRFARSMQELVNALEEFRSLGIDFISYRENADTTAAQGKLIFGIMASLAEFERALIAERVKAGMARAKAQGRHVGRPRIPAQKEAANRRDLLAGRSLRGTIKAHGVGSKTVQRIKAEPTRLALSEWGKRESAVRGPCNLDVGIAPLAYAGLRGCRRVRRLAAPIAERVMGELPIL